MNGMRVLGLFWPCLIGLSACSPKMERRSTSGELQVVHSGVTVSGREALGVVRFAPGDTLATGPDGRARVRLDDGTSVILDRSTSVGVTREGASLEGGRIFVRGGDGAHTEITAGATTTVAAANALALEKKGEALSLYTASGEAVVRAFGRQEPVRSGETAQVGGGQVKVAPEKAFNDWTGGMAAPWGEGGPPRGAICELSALSGDAEDPGTPLAIRSHEVAARIDGEVAVTHVETTFFNGGAAASDGDFRMALPASSIVSRFAVRRGEQWEEGAVREANERSTPTSANLAWAGSGWVRGRVAGLPSGETITVAVDYVEWLSPAAGRLTYRYPMVGKDPAPLLGEFHARVSLEGTQAKAVSASSGAVVEGNVVELRKADFRPQADLVVEVLKPGGFSPETVRAYVVPAAEGDRSKDAYVLARADLPPDSGADGVSLALVVDTSFSISPSELDSERAVVEAILEGLGPKDRVSVYAADQTARAVGPEGAGFVTAERRAAIENALVSLKPGGATDLGVALERAALSLPPDATAAMVVYVGDGWPSVGDTEVEAIQSRLARRAQGIPRIAGITVGASANRYGLVKLASGSAPVLAAMDRADAAETAVTLLAEALQPAVEGVELDLGGTVDRVYPRTPSAHASGTTVTAVGRLRGPLPRTATLRYRRGGQAKEEKRGVVAATAGNQDDVRRRWAEARIAQMALEGIGLETAVDAAVRTSLLTPWTVWAVGADAGRPAYAAPLPARVLDLESTDDVPFASRIAKPRARSGAVLEPRAENLDGETGLEEMVARSARRTLDEAMSGVRKCRDLRAALRPELGGTLDVRVSVDGGGRATTVSVHSSQTTSDDALLDHCVEVLVQSLSFFDSQLPGTITFDHVLSLPPSRDPRKTQCSPASRLPLLVRRGIWRARFARGADLPTFLRARQSCELRTAAEFRAFVALLLEAVRDGATRVDLARQLENAGEAEAATLLRRAAVRDATTPEELEALRVALLGDEPRPGAEFRKKYRAARSDEERLAVVRRFLRLSPHDRTLRERVLALLEALGKKDELANEIHGLRQDPFADAVLLADAAAALLRIGRGNDGLRTFGEIIERAPRDPYARALAGDRLRDEGLFDEATASYEALSELLPGDAAVSLRMALAHAGAGRLDVATRILERVAESEGRGDDPALGGLAAVVTSVLLTDAKNRGGPDAPRLARRALEVPVPDARGLLLVRTPSLTEPVQALVARGAKKGDDLTKVGARPTWLAPSLGLAATRLEHGDEGLRLRLVRPPSLDPLRAAKVRVDLLLLDADRKPARLVQRDLEILPDGHETVLEWNGETWL